MAKFEFDVQQVGIPYTFFHSWVAIERGTGHRVRLPKGGNGRFLGQYPEIEAYLQASHGIAIDLTWQQPPDTLVRHNDGRTEWLFKRGQNEVVMHEIPRNVMQFWGWW